MNTITYPELQVEVADFLGLGRDPAAWSDADVQRIDRVIQDGYRLFLFPPPLSAGGKSHRWSFLTPSATITTEADKTTYDLPNDFAHLAGGLVYEGQPHPQVVVVGEYQVRQVLRYGAKGLPRYACVVPVIGGGTSPLKWQLMLAPTPAGAHTLRYRYVVLTAELSQEKPYPLCGPQHSSTLILACRAQAELAVAREQGAQWQAFMVRLAASIAQDQQAFPELVLHDEGQRLLPPERYVTVGGRMPG